MKNEPAFPFCVDDGETVKYHTGMTLRDYFAAKAMHGLISQFAEGFEPDTVDGFSNISYRVADSMLKERER